jgi:hypothetical protein
LAYVVTLSLRTLDGETASDQAQRWITTWGRIQVEQPRPATVGVHDPKRHVRVVDRHHATRYAWRVDLLRK